MVVIGIEQISNLYIKKRRPKIFSLIGADGGT